MELSRSWVMRLLSTSAQYETDDEVSRGRERP
jgi:hypothetical protein